VYSYQKGLVTPDPGQVYQSGPFLLRHADSKRDDRPAHLTVALQ
jgi:hypothetical protein